MQLIKQVEQICHTLAPAGWRNLLLKVTDGQLDITAKDLAQALLKPLSIIDRSLPGFEDFALSAKQAVEPGKPAYSLLFHALASPAVLQDGNGKALSKFPTLAQLDTVENYIYAARLPSISELRTDDLSSQLAIVVFASEYRPAVRTLHRKHADICYSRTGIARVGTANAKFDVKKRQFQPQADDDPYAFRVMPVRYGAYIAIQKQGSKGVVPQRFQHGDQALSFWVPIHKLFSGSECVRGLTLTVGLKAHHVNEKLSRLHSYLNSQGYETGWKGADLNKPPFIFKRGLAELSKQKEFGSGVLIPVPHENLVEPAVYKNKPLAFHVPKDLKDVTDPSVHLLTRYFSGLYIEPEGPEPFHQSDQTLTPSGESHRAPEIVNVRHKMGDDGKVVNLNDQPDIQATISKGNYWARHYLDFTADGWIGVDCPQLAVDIPTHLAAYSIISAPDFFPYCDQLQLMEWWSQVPSTIKNGLWAVVPRALCDRRYLPNIHLKGSGFDTPNPHNRYAQTATAIVSSVDAESAPQNSLHDWQLRLLSTLPDAASGVFDPGWDITTDSVVIPAESAGDTETLQLFLQGYGLGTPFVEDAKICAALGTYWPAVAPDATRTFQPDKYWPTVCPLTDEEIGQTGSLPWDGIKGPVRRTRKKQQRTIDYVEYTDIDYADYVDSSLDRKLTAKLTSMVDAKEYQTRVLAMAWVYWAMGIEFPWQSRKSYFQKIQTFLLAKARWSVLSFRKIEPGSVSKELVQAQQQAKIKLSGDVIFRFEIYRWGKDNESHRNFRKRWVQILDEATLYTDLVNVLVYKNHAWECKRIPRS